MSELKVQKIKELYLGGFSIAEVAEKVSMSSSGVLYHLKKENIFTRTRSDAVRIKHHKRLGSYSANFPKEIPTKLKNLYLVGLSLYWGEGSKTGNTVAITNSDPHIILTFLSFLRKICKIDEKRLHILVHYHSDQNERELVSYWASITGLTKTQFYKSTLSKNGKKSSTKGTNFGTISLRYSDSLLLKEIIKRIGELKIVNKPL